MITISSPIGASASLGFALLAVQAFSGCGIGDHPMTHLPTLSSSTSHGVQTWEEVFSHPTDLRITAYQTGRVEVGSEVLIDANDPHAPASATGRQWVPALSYLVRHPTRGAFLMDAGTPTVDAAGHCDFAIEPFFHAPCRATADQHIASQLGRDGVSPGDLLFVMLSHMHGDHAGGLAGLAREGPVNVLVAPQEWAAARRDFRALDGYISDQLQAPFSVTEVPLARATEMPLLGPAIDLFDDGSVWVFVMPGHTRGELAALLNTTSGPFLFTFDVSHLRANFEHDVKPGFTVDADAARANLHRLITFAAAYPSVRVIYGHEPSQWDAETTSFELTPAASLNASAVVPTPTDVALVGAHTP